MKTLNDYSVKDLKKAISNHNIKGYSKMNKPQIIKLMLSREHYDKFKDLHEEPRKVKMIKKKPKVPSITITEEQKKIKKKEKASSPVPPLEKKKFKIKLPKEEQAKQVSSLNKPADEAGEADTPQFRFREAMRIYDEKIELQDIEKEIKKNKEKIKSPAFSKTREGQLEAVKLLRRIARSEYEEKQRKKFKVKKEKAPKVEKPTSKARNPKQPKERTTATSTQPFINVFEKLTKDEKTGLLQVDFGRSSAMLMTAEQAKKYLKLSDEKQNEVRKELIKSKKVKIKRLNRL